MMASDVFFRLPACVCLSVCLIMLSYRVVIKLSSAYNRWLRDYAPKSVWRNVEISCHKHFVVVFRHQQTPPTATSDKCHNLPRSGSTVLIDLAGRSVDSTRRARYWFSRDFCPPHLHSTTPLRESFVGTLPWSLVRKTTPCLKTRSLAVAERPRDASCHWIFC